MYLLYIYIYIYIYIYYCGSCYSFKCVLKIVIIRYGVCRKTLLHCNRGKTSKYGWMNFFTSVNAVQSEPQLSLTLVNRFQKQANHV